VVNERERILFYYSTENPENLPEVKWSDMMLYMVTTPSPYTREEIKVKIQMYYNKYS